MADTLLTDGTCRISFRVRYAETDAMGIVHHSQYLVWFEMGRTAYMRAVGMPYSQVERAGYWFTVTEITARYLASARFEDEVTVASRLAELGSRGLTFAYEVTRQRDQTLLVTGTSRHICIDHEGHVQKIPATFLQALRQSQKERS